MIRKFKAAAVAAAALAATTLPLALAAPASATTNDAWTAASICGSGYWNIDRADTNTISVYLSYNGSTDCVVTIKKGEAGERTSVWARVNTDGGTDNADGGDFLYYAGPVYKYAPGQCIYWAGGDYWSTFNSYVPTHCN